MTGAGPSWPSYDHFGSELVLLYVITFAARELRSFDRMASQPPAVMIEGRDALIVDVDCLDVAAGHLWFPGQPHHVYDEWASDNSADFAARRANGEPMLGPHPLVYYSDLLALIVAPRLSTHEVLTGRGLSIPMGTRGRSLR